MLLTIDHAEVETATRRYEKARVVLEGEAGEVGRVTIMDRGGSTLEEIDGVMETVDSDHWVYRRWDGVTGTTSHTAAVVTRRHDGCAGCGGTRITNL